jgi:hypothetical protein
MNTANLQLEGLYAAVAALMSTLRDKGVISTEEIDRCLREAEDTMTSKPRDLSPANIEAIRFPFRYLRAANNAGGCPRSFAAIATEIGMTKDLSRPVG